MKRREFIAGLTATACPLAARAQQQVPVIGYLNTGSPALVTDNLQRMLKAFLS